MNQILFYFYIFGFATLTTTSVYLTLSLCVFVCVSVRVCVCLSVSAALLYGPADDAADICAIYVTRSRSRSLSPCLFLCLSLDAAAAHTPRLPHPPLHLAPLPAVLPFEVCVHFSA